MGVRGELFSTKVGLQNRTYFFNVKENRLGDLYLNIVESKNRDEGGFERQSLILFAEDLQEFLQGFDESLKVLEKAAREKRKGTAPKRSAPPRFDDDRPAPRPRYDGDRPAPRPRFDGDRSASRPRFDGDRPAPRPRRAGASGEERGDRRFSEPRYPSRDRGDRGGEGSFRRERRSDAPRPRGNRDDREGRGDAPRRFGRTGEKPPRADRGEARPRREGRGDSGKFPFPPKKRMVVKKR